MIFIYNYVCAIFSFFSTHLTFSKRNNAKIIFLFFMFSHYYYFFLQIKQQ